MKELKFREVDERYTDENGDGIKLKPFYTFDEKDNIYYDMKSKKNALERDFSLIVLTAKFCTNINFDEMTDNEIYDTCARNQLIEGFKINIDEYMDMHKLIERDETTYKALEGIIGILEDKLKDFDMAKIQEGFSGLSGALNPKTIKAKKTK